MNKRISIIFFMTIFLAISAWADIDMEAENVEGDKNSCDNVSDFDFGELTKVAASSCIDKNFVITKCKCIYKEMRSDSTTIFRPDTEDSHIKFRKEMEAKKEPYKEQYNRVYEKVTIQAAFQEEVLGLHVDAKPVGCTPKDMGDGIRKKKAYSIPTQVEALEERKADVDKKLKKCLNGNPIHLAYGCDYYQNRMNLLDKRLTKMKEGSENCKLIKDVFKTADTKAKLDHFITAVNTTQKDGKNQKLTKKLADTTYLLAIANLKKIQEHEKSEFTSEMACYDMMKSYKILSLAYEEQVVELAEGADYIAEAKTGDADCGDDDYCKEFKTKNDKLLTSTKKQYEPKSHECVTYAEYATFKGMPSDELLQKFANSKHPEKLLYDGKKSISQDAMRFLKANPLIAVVARTQDKNVTLGESLKDMAKSMLAANNKEEGGNLRPYLDFMTKDFKKIYDRDKDASTMAVCEELQRNFTAIELSDDLPEEKDESYDSDPLVKTKQVVNNCVQRLYLDMSTTDLDKTMDLSPIYHLGDIDQDQEPSVDGYQNFKDKYCAGYDEAYRANNCKDKDETACRNGFPGPFRKARKDMADTGTKSEITEDGYNRIAAQTDEGQQDNDFKSWWHTTQGSKTSQQAFAGKNDHGEYEKLTQGNRSITGNPDISSSYQEFQNSRTPGYIPPQNRTAENKEPLSAPGFSKSSEFGNNDQVRFDFSKNNSAHSPVTKFDKEEVQKAANMTEIDSAFDTKTDTEKLASYHALKDFAKKEDITFNPAFNPDEEIKKLEENIAKNEEQQEPDGQNEKTADEPGKPNRTFASIPQRSIVPPVAGVPILGQFPGGKATVNIEKVDKNKASYESALLQMGTGQIVIQDGDAKGPYEVHKTIDTNDQYPFEDLKDPDILSQFIASELGDSVKDGEGIKIVNPKTQEFFIMKATKLNGVTSFQQIPFVPKERIVMLDGLKKEFNINRP